MQNLEQEIQQINRKILFRGFHEDPIGNEEIELNGKITKGKWVYGDFVQLLGVQGKGRKVIVDNNFGACINNDGRFVDTESPFVNEIIPETVSQYTGLDNNNNQKIFENDILRDYSNEVEDWVVSYEYGKFVGSYDNICEDLWELHDLEVVGTIFDKKEVFDEENMQNNKINEIQKQIK